MLSIKFQSDILKIEDFKINPINTFNPISNKSLDTPHAILLTKFLLTLPLVANRVKSVYRVNFKILNFEARTVKLET